MRNTIEIPTYYKITQTEFDKLKGINPVIIECQTCKNEFKSLKKNILKGFNSTQKPVMYCSAKCSNAYKLKASNTEVICTHCNTKFTKTNSQLNKSENHFCSRSCSASFNNKIYIKRTLTRTCSECTNTVFSYRHARCEDHHLKYKEDRYINKTIGEYRNKQSVKGKHPSWINSHIRLFAKSWNKDLVKLPCAKCNYNKHVELAHIKGISTFTDTALLSEINNKANIIQLCPNCHWEFDNESRDSFKQLLTSLNKNYSDQ